MSEGHAGRAARFVANEERVHWHDRALWHVRAKRDAARASVPEWEELRERARQIKAHALSRLADYLEEFETNAQQLGVTVHCSLLYISPIPRDRTRPPMPSSA